MRPLSLFLLSSLALASAASAAGRPAASPARPSAELRTALNAMMKATPAGQANRKVDPDQGDDHASLRAIAVVCSKDTPAATRSAICPTPVSPE